MNDWFIMEDQINAMFLSKSFGHFDKIVIQSLADIQYEQCALRMHFFNVKVKKKSNNQHQIAFEDTTTAVTFFCIFLKLYDTFTCAYLDEIIETGYH